MSYVPHSNADVSRILETIGADSIDDLFRTIPNDLRLARELELPRALSEWDTRRVLSDLADRNGRLLTFAGAGVYDHYVPAAVDFILRRSEFLTSYTPYQPEVSQGTLQVIFEFQTLMTELLGMDAANASMYDGATAVAEAAIMARALGRGRDAVAIADSVHPHYQQVLQTYSTISEHTLRSVSVGADGRVDPASARVALEGAAALIVQQPNFFGLLEDLESLSQLAHAAGALLVVSTNPLACALLRPPGECGADIATAEGQVFGNPMTFGGPALGVFAVKKQYVRQMPGRIAGATVDQAGRRGYVLTLQTREQHIRREKATSNICTNQALMALAATVHLACIGKEGLRAAASASVENAHYAFERITALDGYAPIFSGPFFHEFAVRTPIPAREIVRRACDQGVLPGVALSRFGDAEPVVREGLLIAVTEKRTKADIDRLVRTLAAVGRAERIPQTV
jgi:glycine dehydrogenase subunit 1